MGRREEYLIKLYWALWQTKEFEYAFARDWNAIYRQLISGNHYSIPTTVIEMCFKYLQEWTRIHGNI